MVIITDAEYQYTTFAIGKGRNTLEPTLGPSDLKHLFLVVSSCFTYQRFNVELHNHLIKHILFIMCKVNDLLQFVHTHAEYPTSLTSR